MARGFPDYQSRTFTSAENFEHASAMVSDEGGTASFSQEVNAVLIFNWGPNLVHINFDASATVGHFVLPAKSWLMIDLKLTSVHAICDSGNTAGVFCIGTY